MQTVRWSGDDEVGGKHTECEICLWIKAVRRFEGVAFIHLSLAVKYLLAQTHTYSANNQIQPVCQHQGAIVAHLTGKVFFFSALICQADGSIAAFFTRQPY